MYFWIHERYQMINAMIFWKWFGIDFFVENLVNKCGLIILYIYFPLHILDPNFPQAHNLSFVG